MPTSKQAGRKIYEDYGTEQNIQCFNDLAGGQERCCHNEKRCHDIKCEQRIAEVDTAWRGTFVKGLYPLLESSEGHEDVFTIECKTA